MLMKLYLFGNLTFFKNHVIVLWLGMTPLVPIYVKIDIVGEGPGATLSVLRCFFYLISSLLTGMKHPHSFCPFPMSMSEAFSISFYTLIKLCYAKAPSNQASSLVPNWVPLLWKPWILLSFAAHSCKLSLWSWFRRINIKKWNKTIKS